MKILISGAGIAGLTAAWWLNHQGHEVKIIEIAPDIRDKGYMMDFFGPGYQVAEKMDLLHELRMHSHEAKQFYFVNPEGKVKSSFSYDKFIQLVGKDYALIMRGDLINILNQKLPPSVSMAFNTSIREIQQEENTVQVTYTDSQTEIFDLVVGADGIHSRVRELVFGPESQYRNYMGLYVASLLVDKKLDLPKGQEFYSLMVPDKQAVIYPVSSTTYAPFFVWRTDEYNHLTKEEKNGILKGLFRNMGWIIPEIINELGSEKPLYFDSISQIQMNNWFKSRVVLIGDACACLSLLAGQGASFAMAGAYLLAKSLREANGQLPDAFTQYQTKLKPIITDKQKSARKFANSFVPSTQTAILLRDLFTKIMFVPPFSHPTRKQLVGEHSHVLR